jgi:FAD/FMN-containing dehydrogenase
VANQTLQAANALFLIDLSCYADLGDGTARMVINGTTVTVNTGVREDELDTFLGQHQLMLKTVTAGGFFSLGGMTAVDVHGATVEAPIFAETASAFSIMGPDGVVTTIDANSPSENGWSPLQFARVSLGMLGVVTSITLEVLPRPHVNTLTGGITEGNWNDEADFVKELGALLKSKTRVEALFNPYADGLIVKQFVVCWWNVASGSGGAYAPADIENACKLAGDGVYGAKLLSPLAEFAAEEVGLGAQDATGTFSATTVTALAVKVIKDDVKAANSKGSDLWLKEVPRATFMSYFVELPDLDAAGLGLVFRALKSVGSKMFVDNGFHMAAPLEFRFLRSGNSALAGTYSSKPGGSYVVNFDLVAFVAENATGDGLAFTDKMKQLFAAIERDWVGMGGSPHNGKLYGFYDPNGAAGNYSEPFNRGFLTYLRQQRTARLQAFNAYRQKRDPQGMFHNEFLTLLTGS